MAVGQAGLRGEPARRRSGTLTRHGRPPAAGIDPWNDRHNQTALEETAHEETVLEETVLEETVLEETVPEETVLEEQYLKKQCLKKQCLKKQCLKKQSVDRNSACRLEGDVVSGGCGGPLEPIGPLGRTLTLVRVAGALSFGAAQELHGLGIYLSGAALLAFFVFPITRL